jgi:hypothetical protein
LRLITAILNPEWRRLMPEAYTESLEMIEEFRRCRPQWMLQQTDKHRLLPLFRDWKSKNGFWRRLEDHPEQFTDLLHTIDKETHDAAVRQAYSLRADFVAGDLTMTAHLDAWTAEFPKPLKGWNGDKVEAWRPDTMAAMEVALADKRNAYREWIGCYVTLENATKED